MKIRPDEQMIVNGRLTQVGLSFSVAGSGAKRRYAVFECHCGTRIIAQMAFVKFGDIKSCGCAKKGLRKTHGKTKTAVYITWMNMKERCRNPHVKRYEQYGGRGISVCERWQSFEQFFEDMGDLPFSGAQIDRIDNDGNYTPENCRWTDRKQNSRNKRSNIVVEYHGRKMCAAELAELTNMHAGILRYRLRQGWTVAEAVTTPIGNKRNG